jgi:hypothetical protein
MPSTHQGGPSFGGMKLGAPDEGRVPEHPQIAVVAVALPQLAEHGARFVVGGQGHRGFHHGIVIAAVRTSERQTAVGKLTM